MLWRYMDFTRFVSLLDLGALHFARSDLLGDPFEGSRSVINKVVRTTTPYGDQLSPDVWRQFDQFTKEFRLSTYINCWHQSQRESAAMWRLYAREHDGVAISTTSADLVASLNCEDDIYIGAVNYVDYQATFIPENNTLAPYVYKRKEFEHEREVRALSNLIDDNGASDTPGRKIAANGVYYSVDLHTLVKTIRVAPYADPWFLDLVRSITARYELPAVVESSTLAAEPTW